MSPLARSLLALAAAALLHIACAAPNKIDDPQCTTVMHGGDLGAENELPTVYIPPGVKDASVDVPNPCGRTAVVGVKVKVCDDVYVKMYVPEFPRVSPIDIHRNGDYYAHTATVSVTVWCNLTWQS